MIRLKRRFLSFEDNLLIHFPISCRDVGYFGCFASWVDCDDLKFL